MAALAPIGIGVSERATQAYYADRRRQAEVADGGVVAEFDGILVAARGTDAPNANFALVTRPLDDPTRALRWARRLLEDRGLPFRVVLRERYDPRTEQALSSNGFEVVDRYPELALELHGSLPARLPAPVDVRRVRDEPARKMFVSVIAEAFGSDPDYVDAAIPAAALRGPDASFFVGFQDNQPVATSALFVSDGVAGIWFVATVEAFRRRGIGQAMTAHALSEALGLGSDLAHLEAEADALRLYERIGFQVVARYAEYQAPR